MSDVATLLETATRNLRSVSDAGDSQLAATELAQAAIARHATRVVATSPAAERLESAVREQLESAYWNEAATVFGDVVTLIDVNFASGTSFARAAEKVRQEGAVHVFGIALYCLGEGLTASECGLDELAFLRSTPYPATQREIDSRTSGLAL